MRKRVREERACCFVHSWLWMGSLLCCLLDAAAGMDYSSAGQHSCLSKSLLRV